MAPREEEVGAIRRLRPDGLVSTAAFSHVAVIPPGATTVLVGGQNAVDREGVLVGDDGATQAAQVMDNIEVALASAGATLADVVYWRVLLVDGVDPRPGYAEFQRRWDPAVDPPLVTVAAVAGLAVPGALIEIDAVAALPRGARHDAGG